MRHFVKDPDSSQHIRLVPSPEFRVWLLTDVAVPAGPLVVAVAAAELLVEAAVAGAVGQALAEGGVPRLARSAHPAQVAQAVAVRAAGPVAGALGVGAVF